MVIYRIIHTTTGKPWRSARGLTSWTARGAVTLAFGCIPVEVRDGYEIKRYRLVEENERRYIPG
jgi:hypothetical protein